MHRRSLARIMSTHPSWAAIIPTLLVGGGVFWLAFDGGAYSLESRASLAVVLWWTSIVAVALGVWPSRRPPRAAVLTGGLLAAYALVTLLSMLWAPSAERAFTEFNRVALYLGVFVVAVLAGTRANVGRWSDGIALGTSAIAVLALATRLFPRELPQGQAQEFLAAAITRLGYPVEYWNGLAILLALALPLLLRVAVTAERRLWRALAVGVLPVFAAAVYLTSSRGGVAAGLLGIVAFVALTARRWAAVGALGVGAAAAAGAVAVLVARPQLVNDPNAAVAPAQGRSAALLILLLCVLAGTGYALATRYLRRGVRIAPAAGRVAAAATVLVALVGVAAADPVERFETFKQPPAGLREAQGDLVKAHLLSGNGSGRWQFWGAAVEAWKSAPFVGRGAASYEPWWAQHGSLAYFIRDAHSLYLETLAELGVVGFALLLAAFVAGVVVAARRLRASESEERTTIAALLALFLAYGVAAGIDWMWELTVVSVVGIAVLGLLTGPATAVDARPRVVRAGARSWTSRGFAAGAAALVVGWLVICAQAIPLLAQMKIGDSQEAVQHGNSERAFDDALAARNLQPWAASPYLQLALVGEQVGELDAAHTAIGEAIDRDPENWRLWLVAARIETKMGTIGEARESLDRARRLNPRSPLFAAREPSS